MTNKTPKSTIKKSINKEITINTTFLNESSLVRGRNSCIRAFTLYARQTQKLDALKAKNINVSAVIRKLIDTLPAN